MTTYTDGFKNVILTRLLPPKPETVPEIANDCGVRKSTLYTWRERWIKEGLLQKTNESKHRNSKLNSKDKFRVVLMTASMNETELAEFCRKNGHYPEQVKQWKEACEVANDHIRKEQYGQQASSQIATQKELKILKKELDRKEKALAETAALLVLSKKGQAIWGETKGA